jgi:hypothetical protein
LENFNAGAAFVRDILGKTRLFNHPNIALLASSIR